MICKTFIRGELVRFGQFSDEEVAELIKENWILVSTCKLKDPRQPRNKRVGVNKHGIPIMRKTS